MSDCYYDDAGCLVCPEQEAQAYVPARVERQAVLGWNAGANSIADHDDDLHMVTDMPMGVLGAIIGLKASRAKQTVPSLIEHGWYFQVAGGVDVAQPIESGVPVGSPITGRTASTLFEVRRVGTQITYLMDGSVVHTSLVPSNGDRVVNCCLYASGDGAPSGVSA